MARWTYTKKKRSTQSLTLFPGMLLLLDTGETLIVGHVNDRGGNCDCCASSKRNIVAWDLLPGYRGNVEEDPFGTDALDDEEK